MSTVPAHPELPVGRTEVTTSAMGFGTGAIGNRRTARTEIEALQTMQRAYDSGIRYFDAAPMYGHGLAERRLGAAVHGFSRQDTTVSSKVGRLLKPAPAGSFDTGFWADVPPFEIVYDYSYDGAMRSVEATLDRMLVDRLDIAFIHDCDHKTHGARQPEVFREAMIGARRALLSLRDQGVVGAVGMGVNNTDVIVAGADEGGFDAFLLAGEYTLLKHDSLDDLMPRALRDGFSIIIGSVFNSGILATGLTLTAFFENDPPTPEIARKVRLMQEIGERHGVPLPALAFHFALAHPAVCSVLVGMGSAAQVDRNSSLLSAEVPADVWREMKELQLIREDAPTASRLAPGSAG